MFVYSVIHWDPVDRLIGKPSSDLNLRTGCRLERLTTNTHCQTTVYLELKVGPKGKWTMHLTFLIVLKKHGVEKSGRFDPTDDFNRQPTQFVLSQVSRIRSMVRGVFRNYRRPIFLFYFLYDFVVGRESLTVLFIRLSVVHD